MGFEKARSATFECMGAVQVLVKDGMVPVLDYYPELCSCKDVFTNGMASCPLIPELLQARVRTAETAFDTICALGEKSSWFEENKSLVIGVALAAGVCLILCIIVSLYRRC